MKTYLFISVLFLELKQVCCQNLVPNPSFEDTIECPTSVTEIFKAEDWMSFRESPDYYHGCDNNINGIVGVPSNWVSFQPAHTGNAYAGIIPYDLTGAPYREYLAVKLKEKTEVNTVYKVTFYVSFAGSPGFTIAVNNLGITLTNGVYSESNPYPITNNPIAYDNFIYTDTTVWSKISLSFLSDSAYQYLIIGNFFDDEHTDTLNLGEFNTHSYYLIDDVCLSSNENCDEISGTPGLTSVVNNISLVPADGYLNIKSAMPISAIRIFNALGKLVYLNNTFERELKISCSQWSSGIYILEFNENFKEILLHH